MTNHAVSNRADLRERTKTMSRHGGRRGQITDFRDSFETINWLYLLFKCGMKTKTHFEWLLWHWSSLGQLSLEPTRPNGLVGCKVPTDLVMISVKEATQMGFYYTLLLIIKHWCLISWYHYDLRQRYIQSDSDAWGYDCHCYVYVFLWYKCINDKINTWVVLEFFMIFDMNMTNRFHANYLWKTLLRSDLQVSHGVS